MFIHRSKLLPRISVRLHRLSPDRCFHPWADIAAVDTTFAWASGEPMGLLLNPWNVRLIPHYSLAVLFVISHLAMGLRGIIQLGEASPVEQVGGRSESSSASVACGLALVH